MAMLTSHLKKPLTPCLELAIEGERLCRAGQIRNGVTCFHSALSTGTDDLSCLSAIYCQLGNAYFMLQEYTEALTYHRWDLTLTKSTGDSVGEAQACGNLGNTLKMLEKYEEAAVCFYRQLDLAKQLKKKHMEARALFNLGNLFHAKGKLWARSTDKSNNGGFPPEAVEAQQMAVEYYTQNLSLVRELGDRPAEGRVCGNLGNAHYMLGNFHEAIEYHKQRLSFANEFGDLAAQRRAYSNLGNAAVFLVDFNSASDYYRHALRLAQQLNNLAAEAQACYNLGNTHTLLRDPEKAVVYHLRHLVIARRLEDRVGEGRAYWSLTNAYTTLGRYDLALRCARGHRLIARELGDDTGLMTAQLMIREIQQLMMNQPRSPHHHHQKTDEASPDQSTSRSVSSVDTNEVEEDGDEDLDAELDRQLELSAPDVLDSVELVTVGHGGRTTAVRLGYLNFPETTNAGDRNKQNDVHPGDHQNVPVPPTNASGEGRLNSINSLPSPAAVETAIQADEDQFEDPQEVFFSLLLTSQSRRMDEQRCCLRSNGDQVHESPPSPTRERLPDEALFDLIEGVQGDRMDDQRATLPAFPGLRPGPGLHLLGTAAMMSSTASGASDGLPEPFFGPNAAMPTRDLDDEFLDMILRLQTATRIDDQRSNLPDPLCRPVNETVENPEQTAEANDSSVARPLALSTLGNSCTVPDEDFFALIQRVQSTRLDEQRCNPPPPTEPPSSSSGPDRKDQSGGAAASSNKSHRRGGSRRRE